MNDIKRLLIIIAKQGKVNPDDAYFILKLEEKLEEQKKREEELEHVITSIDELERLK